MNPLVEIFNVKNEPTDSTSSKQQEILNEMQSNSGKQKSDCLVQSEIVIKTEPRENENDFPISASTSFEICSNYDIKYETEESFIKNELENPVGETMQDPLDVRDEIKVKASTSNFNGGTSYKLEQTESDTSNYQEQLFVRNKIVSKDTKFICSICNKTFEFKCLLDTHLRIHTGEKPYSCAFCKKPFTRKSDMDRHIIIHSAEKPYSCNICKKVFSQKSNLNSHKLIHSGAKPFSCDECNESFTQKPHLVVHKRIHTGDKPYTCDLCDKTFTQKSNLNQHRRLHTGEKPYFCDICNKSFSQKSNFNKHKKNHKNY